MALVALDLDATEYGGAADHDGLHRTIGTWDVPGLIDIPSKDPDSFH
jgi:hypothetical protein